jgi:predicted PurR-regulated permease PerM
VLSFLIAFVIALMLVVPILVSQLAEFITRIPPMSRGCSSS